MSAPERTIRLTIDLTYDPESMHGDDPESIEWFQGILSGDDLQLGEFGDLGDMIGTVKVVDCTPTDERVKALEAENARLRELADYQTLTRAQHWLRRHLAAPEDAEVELLCEKHGYGAVMDAASRLWARKPHGQGAFYVGGCIGFKSDEAARAALRDMRSRFD